MAFQRRVYRPANYQVVKYFAWVFGLTAVLSIANFWGNWADIWFLPAMVLALLIITYVYVYKLWRIEITPQGQIFSKAGFTVDFRVDISAIETLEKGTYIFPTPQPVLVMTFTLAGKPTYRYVGPIAWGDKVIGQIIKDLLAINPSIQLDVYAKEFLSKAA
jgi:hypothetical protein